MTGSYRILPALSRLREKERKKETPVVWKKLGQTFWGFTVVWPKIVHLLRKSVLSSKYQRWKKLKHCSFSHKAGRSWQPSISTQAAGRKLGRAAASGAGELPAIRPAAGCLAENIQTASCLAPLCSLESMGEQDLACCGPTGIAKVCGTKKTAALLIPLLVAKTPSAFSVHMYRQSLHTSAPLQKTLLLGKVHLDCCLSKYFLTPLITPISMFT